MVFCPRTAEFTIDATVLAQCSLLKRLTRSFKKYWVQFAVCFIQLLESPIHATASTATLSQKASSGNISGTKRGIIDPLVSKRPEKILNKKIKKKRKNG